jgi:hypothetical protein
MFRFVLLTAIFSSLLVAQTPTGTVLGTITDPNGAVVQGAKIVVVNTQTNLRLETTSDNDGFFTAAFRPVGLYSVEATAPGFKKFRQDGIRLQVGQQARVDVRLSLGDVAESVSVTADAAVVETTSSSIGKVVDNKRINDLPLNTRNVYELVRLTPGVAGGIGNSHNQVGYSVNGVRGGLMDTIIDGSSAAFPTVNGFHGISVFPSVDAVQEFKVQGSNFSAEYGRSLGSVLNLVYKSGTNEFHGTAYEFLRNSKLDANNFFNNQRNIKLASFKRNQFGGYLGGPIKRDKLFFMTSFEALRQRSFSETLFTVPTALQRQGNFSETLVVSGGQNRLIQVFDPFSTRAQGTGFVRDAFAGNVVPANRIDRVASRTLAYWPQPNQPGLPVTQINNFYNSGAASVETNNFDLRGDYVRNERERIFARYSYRRSFDGPPQLFPGDLGVAEGRVNLNDWGTNAVLDYNNTLNPLTILNLRLSFARNKFLFDNQGLGFVPSSLGLPTSLDGAVDRLMFPRFDVAGQRSLGGNDHRQSGFNNWSLIGNISRNQGNHFLKMGYEGRLLLINVWEARAAGTFAFGTSMTQGPNPVQASATAGYGLASFLLGTGSSGNFFQNWKNVASSSFYHAWYIQDDWRVTRKLTLNLGLRYDFDTPRHERFNRMSWFDPTVRSPLANLSPNLTGGLQFVGVDANPLSQYDGDWNNFAPRVGFAYQANSKTVIRGAYGVIFGPSTLSAQGTVGPYGFRVETPWQATLDGITPNALLNNPFPQGFQPVPGARDRLLTAVGGSIEGPLRETEVPYTMQYNFTIQRELPGSILLETAYVGNRGRQLSRGGEGGFTLNQLPAQYLSLGSQLNQLVDNPIFGVGFFTNRQIARGQLLRPYPQFLNVFPLFSSGGNSDYDSLQTTFSKRFSKGIAFEGNYTWSKGLDDGTSHQDSYDIRKSRSITGLQFPHRLVFSGVYEIPVGRNRMLGRDMGKAVDAIVGGWQINGIWTIQSGSPIGIGANNTIGAFTQAARANNNGSSAALDGPAKDRLNRWFDTSVFSQPAPFTFGNVGTLVPDLRAHHTNNLDFSLFKEFRPIERIRFQLRAEAFNIMNRVQFSGPNTTVTSGAFGQVTAQANAPRQLQFGLKLLF